MTTMIQFPERDAQPLTARVSEEVKALMGRHGVSQTELAKWLELHQTAVSARLRGDTEWKVSELHRVAEAFDVHPSVLMGGYSTTPSPAGPGALAPIVRARQDSNLRPRDYKHAGSVGTLQPLFPAIAAAA